MDNSEQYKRECFAREVLKTWTRGQIVTWLEKRPKDEREAMRRILNTEKAKLKKQDGGEA